MSARKIALLLLIAGFGAAVETAWSVRNHLDVGPFGCRVLGGRFYGNSFSFTEETQYAVAEGARVELTNAFGSVRMVQGRPGEVRVKLEKVVYLPTQDEAKAFAAKIALEAENAGARLRLATNRDQVGRRDDVGFETHFDVTVPPGTAAFVRNEHGRVDVTDVAEADVESSFDSVRVEKVAGAARVESRHGDASVATVGGALRLGARHGNVEVRDVTGPVTADVQHGDVTATRVGGLTLTSAHGNVTVETVQGDLDVKAQHGSVSVRGVSGSAQVATSFDHLSVEKVAGDARLKTEHGEIKAEDVKGALTAEASFDGVHLARIGGKVDVLVDHGGLEAEDLEQGARVKSSGDDVRIDGFKGPLQIDARRGSVRLSPAGAITEAVSVTATNGGVTIEVPAGSRFDLEARARRGEVRADVPGLAVSSSGTDAVVGTLAGGGSLVKLSAEGGDVVLEARATTAKAQ